jgi:hypothetical protein
MHVGKNLNARSFFTEPIERLFSSLEKQHERNRVRSEHNAERNNCYLTNPRVMPNLLNIHHIQEEALCRCISQSITIKSEFTKNDPCN